MMDTTKETRIGLRALRLAMSNIMARVRLLGERFVITENGRETAVILSVGEYERLVAGSRAERK